MAKKRLENIDQLQWELDSWVRHYVEWSQATAHNNHKELRALRGALRALDDASRLLFEAFGPPDKDERP